MADIQTKVTKRDLGPGMAVALAGLLAEDESEDEGITHSLDLPLISLSVLSMIHE